MTALTLMPPIIEIVIPTLTGVVERNITNETEKAALMALLDGIKAVTDAYLKSLEK